MITTNETQKYESMTIAYDLLVSARNRIEEIKAKIEQDFRPADSLYFNNPFLNNHNLKEEVDKARTDFTKFIIGYVGQDYLKMNISLDRNSILEFVEQKGYFNHAEIIQFINEKYADVDTIALNQIRDVVKGKMLPNGNQYSAEGTWATANKPEHIRMKGNSAGLELRVWGDEGERKRKISALLKLINIILNNAKPSLSKDICVEQGAKYQDAQIQSLRYFKNNSLKLIFYKKPDSDKIIEAIL